MIRTLPISPALFLALLAAPVAAQTIAPAPSVEEGRAPRPPRAPGIPTALAVEAAQAALASCTASGLKVTTLVVDSVGAPIVLISGDGAALIGQRLASGKARTVIATKGTSGAAQAKSQTDAAFLASLVADPLVGPPRPGAIPIMAGSQLIGALAVAGAPTGAQDEVCARAGLAAIAARVTGAK